MSWSHPKLSFNASTNHFLLLLCPAVINPHPECEEVDKLSATQEGEPHEQSNDATTSSWENERLIFELAALLFPHDCIH